MATQDLKNLSVEQLQEQLVVARKEYANLKLQSKVSSIGNPIQLRFLRRNVARIATILTQNSSK